MTPLFKKLHLHETPVVHVLNAPDTFEHALRSLTGVEVVRTVEGKITFGLAFVRTIAEVEAATSTLSPSAEGDAVIWMVYPKASSKRYNCEFNRDSGWQALGRAGYEPVRQVAIDEDWSALRFRKAEFIRVMRRNPEGAISVVGRKKASEQRRV